MSGAGGNVGAGGVKGDGAPDEARPQEAAQDGARFQPGTVSREEVGAYARAVGIEAQEEREDAGERDRRLRRRRRILLIGGAPAVLVAVVALWLLAVSVLTLAANRAAVAGDYPTAVSRYELVARLNPWLEQWRVHYNLGTARLLDEQTARGQADLERALAAAPTAPMVGIPLQDGTTASVKDPTAPECLVRRNLYAAHVVQWQQAVAAGDAAAARAQEQAMVGAADQCPVDPPPQQSSPPSPDPSASPSQDASPTPQPSPTPGPSASPTPQPDASPSPAPSASGGPSATPSASASASPSPADSQRERLEERNRRSNPEDGGGRDDGSDTRRW